MEPETTSTPSPGPSPTGQRPLLEVSDLRGGYGIVEVLFGLDFHVNPNETVVVLGANGAGKTTTLRAVCGMIPSKGRITFDGVDISNKRSDQLLRMGIAHVPQGRGTINDLTVEENLRAGAYSRKDNEIGSDIDYWYEQFPRLGERRTQLAGSMSGGEQQMLAIARALMARPRLLLLDEPSMGLAPLVIEEVFDQLRRITTDSAMSVLLVEQNANLALQFASRGYVLEAGHLVAEGSAGDLQQDPAIQKAYLGL